MKTSITRQTYSDILFILLLAIIGYFALLFFDGSMSPFYFRTSQFFDQSIFYTIGKGWAEGAVPYIDMWDTKGPIVFFFNMIGYVLNGRPSGVFYVEFINLTVTLIIGYYSLRHWCTPLRTFIYLIIYLCGVCTVMSYGNQSGEWCMAPSMIAILLAYEYVNTARSRRYLHPYLFALFYGFFSGCCLLSRFSDALPIIIVAVCIAVTLAVHRLWHNLLVNILWFIIGLVIVIVPFACYFTFHHALDAMIYTVILYNIEYALNSNIQETFASIRIIYLVIWFSPIFFLAICGIVLQTAKEHKYAGVVWTLTGLITFIWICKSFGNANYSISWMPFLLIPLLESNNITMPSKFAKKLQILAVITIVFVIGGFANGIRNYVTQFNSDTELLEAELRLGRQVPHDSKFIAYNCHPSVYTELNLKPCYAYCFGNQDWAMECGSVLNEEIRESFAKGDADIILVYDINTAKMRDIILKRYTTIAVDKKHKLSLMRLKTQKQEKQSKVFSVKFK